MRQKHETYNLYDISIFFKSTHLALGIKETWLKSLKPIEMHRNASKRIITNQYCSKRIEMHHNPSSISMYIYFCLMAHWNSFKIFRHYSSMSASLQKNDLTSLSSEKVKVTSCCGFFFGGFWLRTNGLEFKYSLLKQSVRLSSSDVFRARFVLKSRKYLWQFSKGFSVYWPRPFGKKKIMKCMLLDS